MPPVTISGWVGVIIEKIIAGYLDRIGDGRSGRQDSCGRSMAPAYGIQRQLRQARARRYAVRQHEEAQMTGAALDPSERQPSRVG